MAIMIKDDKILYQEVHEYGDTGKVEENNNKGAQNNNAQYSRHDYPVFWDAVY